MKKVIIVTRSSEYGSFEKFQDAIDARECCRYNKNDRLIRFLSARKQWNDAFLANNGGIIDTYESVLRKEYKPCGQELANVPFDAIRELMTKINDIEPLKPYASFYFPNEQSPEWEVILVLCDCANIKRYDCLQPEDLFLDCICDDLELSESTDSILYVHPDQIGFEKKDRIVVDKHQLIYDVNGNRTVLWANKNKNRFQRIACFVHEIDLNGIFKRNILEKDFAGRSIIDDVDEAYDFVF